VNADQWSAVDQYIDAALVQADASLQAALAHQDQSGLPAIAVSPAQGKLLQLLARSIGARRILEIGTLGGYSTIWMAQALPADGRLITLEIDPRHAQVARENFRRAQLDALIELREGRALDTLDALLAAKARPFDFTFIDADKASIPEYFEATLALSRAGSLIVVDNVVRKGAILDADSSDPAIRGVRRLNDMLSRNTRVSATTIQTVGSKGYDGFTLALVK
jgi:predicted O-methyltransferase YrrM